MDNLRQREEQPFLGEEMKPIIPSHSTSPPSPQRIVAGISKELLDSRTRVKRCGENVLYFFDYKKNVDDAHCKEELLDRHILKKLLKARDWELIKHPFVLNFINEKLINSALVYGMHCIIYFVFLFLLYSFVVTQPNYLRSIIVSIFLIFFIFFMFLKFMLKQVEQDSFSIWFIISYTFNILTYITTAVYIWHHYIFSFDDYYEDTKIIIAWFLPIISVISAWVNCLYVLRKSPFGVYILMMKKILGSFFKVSIIWIPTLIAFSFAFQLIMKDTGTEPWDDKDFLNNTLPFMAVLQSLTKTSAMMVGELDANDFLERKQWLANILLIFFEIITVILLMNLLISLAVGDVQELRHSAEGTLLKIKLNYCLESLQMAELCTCFSGIQGMLNTSKTNNVLVINSEEEYSYSFYDSSVKIDVKEKNQISNTKHFNWHMDMADGGVRILQKRFNHQNRLFMLNRGSIIMNEFFGSGIMEYKGEIKDSMLNNNESYLRRFKRWLIGFNWNSLIMC
uniref:Ion_trans domain-containing protein n=1 Tax=Parastrongyloides trichosuri TaxID=131310 RepID=A0A0N4ZYG6_PARTI